MHLLVAAIAALCAFGLTFLWLIMALLSGKRLFARMVLPTMIAIITVLSLLSYAWAQQQQAGDQIVGFLCQHQETASWLLGALLARLGIGTLNAIFTKLGVTPDSRFIGVSVPLIKMIAMDFHPPAHVLAQQAAQAQQHT